MRPKLRKPKPKKGKKKVHSQDFCFFSFAGNLSVIIPIYQQVLFYFFNPILPHCPFLQKEFVREVLIRLKSKVERSCLGSEVLSIKNSDSRKKRHQVIFVGFLFMFVFVCFSFVFLSVNLLLFALTLTPTLLHFLYVNV